MRRTGQGISVEVPVGWSAAVVRRDGTRRRRVRAGRLRRRSAPGGRADPADLLTERTLPVLHVSTRPLPADGRRLRRPVPWRPWAARTSSSPWSSTAPTSPSTGLFEKQGVPRLAPSQFGPHRMPRDIVGRSASQHFFSVGGRAFCLFTVLGSHSRRMATVPPRPPPSARSLETVPAATMHARGVSV